MPPEIDYRQIVVVEPNPDDRMVFQWAFDSLKLRLPVVYLKEGEEALEYFFKSSGACQTASLVIMSMTVPDVEALNLLIQLRSNRETRHIPIIILTHHAEDELVMKGYSFGANSYILKEKDFHQFREKLACVADYWLNFAQLPTPIKAHPDKERSA